MNSKPFSLFLVITLVFSVFSISANGWSTYENTEYSINLSEDLAISSESGQKTGNIHKISLDEKLEVANYDKYQKLVTATKQLTERYAIMDRVTPNTRLRFVQDGDLLDPSNQITMPDFIEIITDTFYDGGAKTPSMPSIPLAFPANLNSDSLQLLQVNEMYGEELESVYSDTGPPLIASNNYQGFSQISLGYTPNYAQSDSHYYSTQLDEFSSNITPITLDFTETLWSDEHTAILSVTSPVAIYIILFADGVVPAIRRPQIPESTAFYFVFSFFVFTTFSTPFAIGNNMWGTVYGDMDNSTSTNSTQIDYPEDGPSINMTQIEQILQNQNSTVTETDNVADGPKHYSISISEGLNIGDGQPTNNQISNESVVDESSTDTQISESASFSDQLEIQTGILPDGTISLEESISFNDEIEGISGIDSVKISESVLFDDGAELYRPLNVMISISEYIELSAQITIDGIVQLQINEFLRMSEEITIHTLTIIIEEDLQIYDQVETQFVQIALNEIPVTNIIPQNVTLALNGTSYLETNQDIAESVNQITISAWIKPEFNAGTPQMVAISKDLTFQMLINSVTEPQHVPIFTIYDGMTWHEIIGTDQLVEGKWHHIAGVLDGSKITMFVDGKQQQTTSIPELFLVNEQGWLTENGMSISISESDIVIGADYDEQHGTSSSRFSGHISGVSIHDKALDVELIEAVLQNTIPYSTTEIILTESLQISDIQGLSGSGVVNVNEQISFTDMMGSDLIALPIISTEYIDLMSLNSTYASPALGLNGTEFVTVQDTISSEINKISISSWFKPEFNSGTPQFTIASKENSFNLYVTNIVQPTHTVGFSVFDGVQWNGVLGNSTLDDRWHHVMALVDGSNITLYVDGNLEDEITLQNEFSIGENGEYVINDSQISVSDSDIVIGAYVSTVRNEIQTSDKFVGKIASVDAYTGVLTTEQISYKYEAELSELYQYVSLYETIQVDDELFSNDPFHVKLDETLVLYEFAITDELDETSLDEIENIINLDELLIIQETIFGVTSSNHILLEDGIHIVDEITVGNEYGIIQSSIQLEEFITLGANLLADSPFDSSVNPEVKMVKSGFLITESPKFELEYYSEIDAVKIDRQELINATSIANQLHQDLASTPGELLSKIGINEITTAIQVAETRLTISELEDQVGQTTDNISAEDIRELQEKVEEVTESILETAKRLEETHLEERAEEIINSAEIIVQAADIRQNLNQTGTWQTTDETISTKIISPDGSIFSEKIFFEKMREGKFGIEVLVDDPEYKTPKPGIYTIENTITVDDNQYTINEEFAWGLVSLNTKKSTYYPDETAEFVIVVLDSVGSPVCDANLVMTINETTLSSDAGITANPECGIYDATYDTGVAGTYIVDILATADGIQTGFETTFDVADYIEFDIIRTAQSKIDPINNPNEFEVIVDITSHTDTTDIQIIETVPSVFGVYTDGETSTEGGITTITWNKTLADDSTQISYTYSVPLTFPELYPLGGIQINYDGKSYTEARPWFVANDPLTISATTVNLDEVIVLQDTIFVITSTNIILLYEEIHLTDKITVLKNDDSVENVLQLSTVRITKDTDGVRQGLGMGMTSLGDLDGDGVDDLAIGAASGDRWYGNPSTQPWPTNKDGAVYITYMNSDGSIKYTVTIDKDTTNGPIKKAGVPFATYGKSIENLGDLDGDGVVDIAVGAPRHSGDQGVATGVVYIHFLNADGSVKSTAMIDRDTVNGPSPKLAAGDHYGADIANMGDLDGDGVVDIAVGADEKNTHGLNSYGKGRGAVYIHYLNSDGSLKEGTVQIKHETTNGPNVTEHGGYGNSVENIGDLDGDGVNDMAVGENHLGTYGARGNLHIHFMNADGSIKSTNEIDPNQSSHMGGGDRIQGGYVMFGSSIVGVGDQDGDGVVDIAVGAPWEGYYSPQYEMGKGAVYILLMKTDGTVKDSFRIDENIPNGPDLWSKAGQCCNQGGQFGSSLASAKINDDYQMELIVGAPTDETAGQYEGAVWVIFYNGGYDFPVVELEESISLTDAITIHPTILLSETLSLTDANWGGFGKTHLFLSETLSFTDVVTIPEKDITHFIYETVSLSDSLIPNSHLINPTISETLSLTYAVTNGPAIEVVISSVVKTTKDSGGVRQGFGMGMASLGDLDGDGVVDLAIGAADGDKWYGTWSGTFWSSSKNGAVYITYMNADGTIKSTVTIDKDTTNGPGSSAASSYGKSIVNLGDLDGDGVVDIAVGADKQDSAKGEVYIHFLNADGSVKSTATIKDGVANAPDLAAGDHYGSDIANMGDLDGDGVVDIAVGADEDSSNGNNKGAVYIHYLNSDGSLKEGTVKIRHGTTNGPDITYQGGYGNSVENIGDLDGDGVVDMAVGETNHPQTSGSRGYIHIHLMNADGSIKSTNEINPNSASDMPRDRSPSSYVGFGTSITNIGDYNRDGINDIAVGASMDGYYHSWDQFSTENIHYGKMSRGSIYILHMDSDGTVKDSFIIDEHYRNGPNLTSHYSWSGGRMGQFGSSIASADINGDKKLDLIVGTPSDSEAGDYEGAIYIIYDHNGPTRPPYEFKKVISETLTLTGIANTKQALSLSETLSLSAGVSNATRTIMLSESISFSDTTTFKWKEIGIIETLALTDVVTIPEKDVTWVIDETLQLTDSIVTEHFDYETGPTINLTESISFTDKITTDMIISIIKITKSSTNAPSMDDRHGLGAGLETLGDLDGDGVVDLAVGATMGDKAWSGNWLASSTPYGAVFIWFMNADGSIKSTVTIDRDTANGPGSSAMNGYGSEIANLGDLDGDGVVDIAVGDRGYNDDSIGAVYIHYLNSNGSVKSTVTIDRDTANGPSTKLSVGDRYGSDIANMGDLDGDGVVDIAVGAEDDSSEGPNRGAVYIHYLNSNGSVKSTVKIAHGATNGPDVHTEGMYGSSVENIGDLDGDGVNDMAVGEIQGKGQNTYRGALHIHFMNTDGSIKSTQEINTGNPTSNVNGWLPAAEAPWSASEPWVNAKPNYYTTFGSAITSVGDHDGDGVNDLAVGAQLDGYGCDCDGDGNWDYNMGTGAVYILHMKTDGTVKSSIRIDDNIPNGSTISSYPGNSYGGFGTSITWADLDNDYTPELIVGAASDRQDNNYSNIRDGAVYIITWNGGKKFPIVELEESISLTDAMTIRPTILLSETLSLTDANWSGFGKTHLFLSETLSFTDVVTIPEKDITHFIYETASLSDSLIPNFHLSYPSISETVSLTDAVTGVIEKDPILYENIRLTKDSDGSRQGFGSGMTSLGDLDGDGVVDLAIGAAASDKGYGTQDGSFWTTDRNGAVYIMYMNADNTVKSTVTIDKDTTNVPSSTATASYGRAIENLGDIDGDGVVDIAVGADWQDSQSGAVYIHFLNANGSVKSTATIKDGVTNAPDLTAGDRYGTDIANMGDLDGDGVNDIAVGADHDSSNGDDKGAVYIHYLNSNGSLKEDTVKIRHGTTNGPDIYSQGGYGNSVENIGDLDGDGVNDMAVGESNDGTHGGRGYLHIHLMNADESIKSTNEIDPYSSSDMPGDKTSSSGVHFASSIVNIGDHNNDGVDDLAIGASMEGYWSDTDGVEGLDYQMGKGAVYILHMKTDGTVKESFRINEDTQNGPSLVTHNNSICCTGGGQFGSSMASVDIDGNGIRELIVGAPSDNTVGTYEGSVWIIYDYNGAALGSQQFAQSISETLALTTTVRKKTGISLSETLSLSDAATGESVVIADSTTVSLSETLVVSDTTPSIPINIIATDAENLLNPEYVEIFTIGTNTYAIVTQPAEDKVTIYDVSDPTNIVVKDAETDGANGFTMLDGAVGVNTFVIGSSTYAIVTASSDNGVQIIDISDPTNIVAKDAETDGANGFTRLESPLSGVDTFVIGSSTYAIVTSKDNDGVQIIDISDPTNIVAKDAETDGANGFTELQGAYASDIFTIGTSTYAIVTAIGDWGETAGISKGVQIIDVSDPTNIVAKDEFTNANLVYPGGVETFTIGTSTYAIVTGYIADTVQILDISNPANIVAKDTLANSGSLELNGAFEVNVFTIGSSTYAIITGFVDDGVQIIDVSDPTNIVAVDAETDGANGFTELEGAVDVETFVIGTKTYAIIVSLNEWGGDDGGVQMLQLSTDEEFAKKSANVSISETISLTDSVSKDADKRLSETLAISVATTGETSATEYSESITESLSLTDAVSKGQSVTQYITDSVSLTDSVSKDTDKKLSETIALTDSASRAGATTVSLLETISLTDAVGKEFAVTQFITESISLTDSVSKAINILLIESVLLSYTTDEEEEGGGEEGEEEREPQEVTESISFTDSITKEVDKRLSETIALTDSASRVGTTTVPLSETLQVSDVKSSTTSLLAVDAETDGDVFTELNGARNVVTFVIGSSTYAIVAARADNGVQIIDVSDPTDIVAKDAETDGVNGFTELNRARGVETFVIGSSTYAIVTAEQDDAVQIIDISDPTNIVAKDAETDGSNGFTRLNGARGVDTFVIGSSTYAIVASKADNGVQMIDVSDPTDITAVDTAADGDNGFTELSGAVFVETFTIGSSTYAIVTARSDNGVQIIDISDPTNIVAKDAETDGQNGFTELDGAYGIDTFTIDSSTYAIVTSKDDNGVQIIDISDPTNIVAKDAETDGSNGFTELDGAQGVETFTTGSSTYAIVTAIQDDGVQIIDVSDPTDIVAVNAATDGDVFTELNGAQGVDIFTIGTSTYAIVTADQDDGVQMIQLSTEVGIVTEKAAVVSLSESISLADSVSSQVSYGPKPSPSPGPTTRSLSESISLTDSVSKDADKKLSETIALTDSTSRAGLITVSLSETLQVSDVKSSTTSLLPLDAETDGQNGFTELNGARGVDTFVIGSSTYAIVAARADFGVQIIDISDPTDIVAKDAETKGVNGFTELAAPIDVETFTIGSSTYAIVTAINDDGVQIIDVSDPTNIVAKDAETDGSNGFTELNGAHGVDIFTIGSSTYAIVTAFYDNGVQIIDISDPTNIVAKDAETDGANGFTKLQGAEGVETFTIGSSTYAIVAGNQDGGVQIIDVSDPTDIVAVDAATDGQNGFTELNNPNGVETFVIGSNTYAIVTADRDDGVQIIDVSDPTNIVAKDAATDGGIFTELNGAQGVDTFTFGTSTYAIVTALDDDGVQIIDISDPTNITAVDAATDGQNGFTMLDGTLGAEGVETFTIGTSTYAIVTADQDDGVQMIQLSTEVGVVTEKTTSVSLSESISLTDSVSHDGSVTVSLSETVSLTDSVSKDTGKKLSESISLTDSASRAGATTVSLSESITLLDSVSRVGANTVSLSESISLTDSVSKDADKRLSETITLTDSTSRAGITSVPISESISLTDDVSNAAEISLAETISLETDTALSGTTSLFISESVSLTDSIIKQADITLTGESLSLTDSVSRDPKVFLTESISLTDGVSGIKAADISLSETISLDDSISKEADKRLSDSVALTDSTSSAAKVSLLESISLTDSVSNATEISLSESISLDDSISKQADITLSAESLSLTDSVSRAGTSTVPISESLSLTDSISNAAEISLEETISLETGMELSGTVSVFLSETISLDDGIVKQADITLSAESLSLTDSVSREPKVLLTESLSLADSISGIKAADISLSETILLEDSITKAADITLSDSVALTDSTSSAAKVSLLESISLTDSVSNATEISLSESISLDDSIVKQADITLSAESLSLTDSVSRAGTSTVPLSESISLTDSASNIAEISLEETISLEIGMELSGTVSVFLSETISLDDSISKGADIYISDSVAFTDSTIAKPTINLSESISLIDSVSGIKDAGISLSETILLEDSITKAADITLSAESLSLTDSVSVIPTINLSESISLIDSISSSKDTDTPLLETISFTVEVITPENFPVNISETLSFADDLLSPQHFAESVSFTDTVVVKRSPLAPEVHGFGADEEAILGWKNPGTRDHAANPQLGIDRVAEMTDYRIQQSFDGGTTWITINDGVDDAKGFSGWPGYEDGIDNDGDGFTDEADELCPAANSPCIANGVEATFRVMAINSVGPGPWSNAVNVTPVSDDDEIIQDLMVDAKPKAIRASWFTVVEGLTDPIIDYHIHYTHTPMNQTSWILHDDGYGADPACVSSGCSVIIDDIDTLDATFVKVTPVIGGERNGCPADEALGGDSQIAWSDPLKQTPRAITDYFKFPKTTSVNLEWEYPEDDGGEEVWAYDIRWREKNMMPAMPDFPWQMEWGLMDARWNYIEPDAYGWYEYKLEPLVWWGDDNMDNDGDGWRDEADEQVYVDGIRPGTWYQIQIRGVNDIGEGVWSATIETKTKAGQIYDFRNAHFNEHEFNFATEGAVYGSNMGFTGTKNFGAGQTFSDNTEFAAGQTFSNDVNFAGAGIKFSGAEFGMATSFGDAASFTGTQSFTGTNTFGDSTVFDGAQDFSSAGIQEFGDGVEFKGITKFATGQTFGENTKFAEGQEFDASANYDFDADGLSFGAGVKFGKAVTFGEGADFSNGVVELVGTNTFGYGTKFAEGQSFTTAQVFGQGVDFEDGMEFADNQVFALDYDFDETGLEFGAGTVFCGSEEIGAGAEFDDGVVEFGGAMTFKSAEGMATKFAEQQEFEHIMDFTGAGEFEFFGDTEFQRGQDFEADVEFKELFDYDDMKDKALKFLGEDVHFFMPESVDIGGVTYTPPLSIPPGTTFGDGFDMDDMWADADGDGMNDEYYLFDEGVEFAADTTFPPNVEFAKGFSFDDMDGKEFTFMEGVFMAGDDDGVIHFPEGQRIKPGILWGAEPKFDSGVILEAGLAIPVNATFSAGLQMPSFVAAPYGMLLEAITCDDADCIPDSGAYLKPGDLLPPGVDPPPVVNFITASNKTFANPGLGFEMEFDTVAKDGKVSVDLKEPTSVPGTFPGSNTGQRSMILGTDIFQNVGSIIDVSVSTAEASGAMTVTLPYNEDVLGGGSEDSIVLLHYTGGEWVTVSDITIDKINNKVSGTVSSLSPFTVGTRTGSVSSGETSGRSIGGGPGGGGGGVITGESNPSWGGYPSLKIFEVTYDTDANMVRVVVGPEYDTMDVIVKTSMGFNTATKIASHPILNQAIYEVQLLTDRGPLQVSAAAFVGPIVIEATPVITTISAGTETILPEGELTPPLITTTPDDFQKPDKFITDKQCPLGTSLVNGKCTPQTLQEQPLPVQLSVILLLVLLAAGLLLAGLRISKRKAIVSSQLLLETEDELIRKPSTPDVLPPSIRLPELVEEESDLIKLLQTLHEQEVIQEKLHLLESQLLEYTKEEIQIRNRLAILLQLVEIRVHLVQPLLPQQLKPLPAPRRTYKKKRKVLSDEHKAKIAVARIGKRQTEETKQKIAESRTGRKMSDEHKAKIAAARTGKRQTEVTKQKIAESRTGRKMSESTKQRISKSKKTRKDRENEKRVKLDELIKRYNIVSDEEYSDET